MERPVDPPTDPRAGLTAARAAERLRDGGPNELPAGVRRGALVLLLGVLREPMFLLLALCGGIYLVLGDRQEAAMLLAFVVIVAAITLYQEHKTERALEALRDLSSPRALVVRDGRRVRIASRDVVPGDVLVLAEGDRVAADAAVLSCLHLATDESLLSGESVPVRKSVWDGASPVARPGGEDLAFVFAGTLVTGGAAVAQVLTTGARTEMGRIGKALESAVPERTALQRETALAVRRVAIVAVALCALVVVFYGVTRAQWLTGFLAGLTLAMAILPNELPAVLAIFLAAGAWRISRVNALARRVPVLEALGAATVLCVDKTGTLTQNRMTVRKLYAAGRVHEVSDDDAAELPEFVHEIVEYAILASQRDPFDPMERAFHALGERRLAGTPHLHPKWQMARQYPLSHELLALSHAWTEPDGAGHVIGAKGAHEAIADLCHLPPAEASRLHAAAESMAGEGLRVLGVARARNRVHELPANQHDIEFDLLGLAALEDPVRPAVPGAIAECRAAGVRVVMITGDHPHTAASIGRKIGLTGSDDVVTGADLARMDAAALRDVVGRVNVFARVAPEQKLLLVRALKSRGEVVAMTGDGVNDAPALKSADIGIAMGGRGTDVAREAAGLVILDDDFATIVASIRLGRRIFDNLKSAMAYILAVHVPIAGITVLPVLLGLPLVLLPVHVAFLHLIIEPACSIVFEVEPADPGAMRRPPRDPRASLFDRRLIGLSVLQGSSVLAILLGVYMAALHLGKGELEARGLAFTTLVVASLALILVNRSWSRSLLETLRSPNRALWWVVAGAVALLGTVLYVPFLRDLFRMSALHADDLGLALAAGLLSIGWFEVVKAVARRRR